MRPPFLGLLLLTLALPTLAQPTPAWNHDWARGAVFYEVFVRSFADSNGDGIGDLNGLTARLDDLNDGNPATSTDLGVDALWLMPVFDSPSYHGYDVVDYEAIEPDYGTLADFERLLAEAHKRGIRVIVDLVMNHSSAQHPWFKDSASGPDSPKRRWYVWRQADPGWTQPWGGSNRTWHKVSHPDGDSWYYGVFWGGMPDLNFAEPAVREEMKRIAKHWLDRGVDGFRLDATRHLFADGPGEEQNDRPETHAFLRELGAFVRGVKPEAVLVGENWTDAPRIAAYFGSTDTVAGGDELPMNFNFPLAAAILDSVKSGDAGALEGALVAMAALYPQGVLDAPFLTNHDMHRVATVLDGDPARLRAAAAILLSLPGAPFLYYGEEVGLVSSAAEGDFAKRTPMPWDASGRGFTIAKPWLEPSPGAETANVSSQRARSDSLLAHYRAWIQLRRSLPALTRGEITVLDGSGQPEALAAWVRHTPAAGRVLVVHNLSAATVVAGPWKLEARALLKLGGEGTAITDAAGIRVELPPWGSAVFGLE